MADEITLDPNDPVERVIIEMVSLNRSKRHDYADDKDLFSNFRESGAAAGVDAITSCEVLIGTKQSRLRNLYRRKSAPLNESIRDSKIDRAVYSVIAVALHDEKEAGLDG